MTDGDANDARPVLRRRQRVRLHVQLGVRVAHRRPRTSRRACCRVRAPGLDRRLPTLGTGDYEWRGFLDRATSTRAASSGPGGLLLNWNNQSAPGLHARRRRRRSARCIASSCSTSSRRRSTLADDVSVMNRAATEDVRSPVWPVVSQVLRGGAGAERARRAGAGRARRLGRSATRPASTPTSDGKNDDAGAADHGRGVAPDRRSGHAAGVRRSARRPRRRARPRRPRGRVLRRQGPAHAARPAAVSGKFHLQYCGNGSLDACRASLWAAFEPRRSRSSPRRARIRRRGAATRPGPGFVPGLIPDTIRATNRPTFQQVLELTHAR